METAVLESPRIQAVLESMPTERGLRDYEEHLDISKDQLLSWKTIVDIGSGTQQEFAKEMRAAGYAGTILSTDPSLALPEEEDLARFLPEEHAARLEGRHHAEKGTIAAVSQALPIRTNSIETVLALYSVPRWIKDPDEMKSSYGEIIRVLKGGGEARVFPISLKNNLTTTVQFLEKADNIQYTLLLKEKVLDEEKYLLIIKKTKNSEIYPPDQK